MIIDNSYFIGSINLPGAATEPNSLDLSRFIEVYEPELLKCVLGKDLYTAFIAGTETEPYDQRWYDLLNGVSYEFNDHAEVWGGFSNDIKLSPIAQFVYFKYRESRASQTVLNAEVVSDTENNTTVSPREKMVIAWNTMTEMLCSMRKYLKANTTVYPEWVDQFCACEYYHKINSFDI